MPPHTEERPLAHDGPADPRHYYRQREARARADAERLAHELVRLGRLRVAVFASAVAPLFFLEGSLPRLRTGLLLLAVAAALLFVTLVLRFRTLKRRARNAHLCETLASEALARLDRRWEDLPPEPSFVVPPDHPSADDLDLVGHASLSHLLGRVTTAAGRSVLRSWLLDPFDPLAADPVRLLVDTSVVAPAPTPSPGHSWMRNLRERQHAVRLLAREPALLHDIEHAGRSVNTKGRDRDTLRFLKWIGTTRWLAKRRHYVYAARILALATPASLIAWGSGLVPGILPTLSGLCAYALQWRVARQAAARFSAAEAGENDLMAWRGQLVLAAQFPEGSVLLDRLRDVAHQPHRGAARALEELTRITHAAGTRYNALLHFPLVVLFAWDVLMLDLLERWHARHADAVPRWIRTMGEIEALAALGGLLYDHPDWTFPEFTSDPESGIRASALGHPLLDPRHCVRNEVDVPSAGCLLLVTGSNMAGKTTLLRTIGVNQVLALSGGPVAAARFATQAVLPWCVMRVRDSLEHGVSYFLAELKRLERLVVVARASPVLFLLDEILQGTNSAERRTAARIVLAHLLETNALGAVTTHDLGLPDTPELEHRVKNVHFREHVTEVNGERTLDFDYVLRPGVATSRNALLLLEIAGLGPTPSSPC